MFQLLPKVTTRSLPRSTVKILKRIPETLHFSRAREFSGTKWALTCIKKLLGVCHLRIFTHRECTGVQLSTNRGLMKWKNDYIESWFQYAPCGYRADAAGGVLVRGLYREGD